MRLFNCKYGLAVIAVGIISTLSTFATEVSQRVYMNRGAMLTVDSLFIPALSYNSTATFNKQNVFIELLVGDTLHLTLVNNDTVAHQFQIKNHASSVVAVLAQDSVQASFIFSEEKAYVFYDPSENERYRYLGLGSAILVKKQASTTNRFYWNIKDHDVDFHQALAVGEAIDWKAYYPTYFTINGNSNPYINQDAVARVIGAVGDTLRIYMVNTGVAIHSLHFHGYHATIVQSSKYPSHVGRKKDTFPVHGMELVVIELMPDKVGEYPVHDHNLVAVSGGNIYPNGMFLTMLIQ
jgi:hypothetical protein